MIEIALSKVMLVGRTTSKAMEANGQNFILG